MGLTHECFGWDFKPDERHLARLLKDAGWDTMNIGYLHETRNVAGLGFDDIVMNETIDSDSDCIGLASASGQYLAKRKDAKTPFYLQLNFFETHRPFDFAGTKPDDSLGITVPAYLVDDDNARKELAAFQGVIRKTDAAVGQVLNALEKYQLSENTLVILTADHGIPFPRAKCMLYDPGLEILFAMRWPAAKWQKGKVVRDMISNVDLVPTFCDLLSLPMPDNIQGQSFAYMLNGEENKHRREIFAEITYHEYMQARRCIRTNTHKLIVNFVSAQAVVNPTEQWQPLTSPRPNDPPTREFLEVYDLKHDPLETQNIARCKEYRQICNELLAILHNWMKQTDDPLLKGLPVCLHYRNAIKALQHGYPDLEC